jgi:hypothetical protein
MEKDPQKEEHSWVEEIEIVGDQLVGRVKELIKEGNVRRLIIRKSDGQVLLEVPLSAGLAVGGVTTLLAPVLVALGAMAGLLASFKIEVVRRQDEAKEEESDPDQPEP